jgi:hypothetical protein
MSLGRLLRDREKKLTQAKVRDGVAPHTCGSFGVCAMNVDALVTQSTGLSSSLSDRYFSHNLLAQSMVCEDVVPGRSLQNVAVLNVAIGFDALQGHVLSSQLPLPG